MVKGFCVYIHCYTTSICYKQFCWFQLDNTCTCVCILHIITVGLYLYAYLTVVFHLCLSESRRTRFFSEGSAVPETVPPNEPAGDNAAEPLPDVVAIRRSRANSAPARPVAPEIATGRELRRIGDEFVALFEGQRVSFKSCYSCIIDSHFNLMV